MLKIRPLSRWTILAAAILVAGCSGGREAFELDPETPVILVVIDTLRADHLSCYSYDLPTSPNLDAFARTAYLFENNTTQFNATYPSLTSILTGLYPRSHGNYQAVPVQGSATHREGVANLAERLEPRGYHRIAVVSHPSWGSYDRDSKLAFGWDEISVIGNPIPVQDRLAYGNAAYTNERLFGLLEAYAQGSSDKPLFVWAHYFDPHTDYVPYVYNAPPKTRDLYLRSHLERVGLERYHDALAELPPVERPAYIRRVVPKADRQILKIANGTALYDAEITTCDEGVQAFFERLKTMGIYDRALIIVMADHGENLDPKTNGHGEIAFTHKRLFEPVAHTPLLVKLPHQDSGARISALTQNIDVAPTIMQLLDLSPRPAVEGKSLVPLLADSSREIHTQVFIESSDGVESAVKTRDLKYIHGAPEETPLIYEWRKDHGERTNLAKSVSSEQGEALVQAIREFKPPYSLRVELLPDAQPYTASVVAELGLGTFERALGHPALEISEDSRSVSWSGTVESDAVSLLLFPTRRNDSLSWRITRSGEQDLARVIRIGKLPLAETTAIPRWRAGSGPAPAEPQLELRHLPEQASFSAKLFPRAEQQLDVELRYANPAYDKKFEALAMENFEQLKQGHQQVYVASTRSADPALLLVKQLAPKGEPTDVLELYRFDGTWPETARIALDEHNVDRSVLEFTFPSPIDKRLGAALGTGFFADRTPPGSIVLWSHVGRGGKIDTARMSEAEVEGLRALGYVDFEEDED